MNINGFEITKAQRGWLCDCHFSITTSKQFTDELHISHGQSRWLILSILKSTQAAGKTARELSARPGERAAKGWAN